MKTIKLSAASRTLAEYAADLSNEIVVVTDRDRPVAAIVPLKGLDPEAVALSGHPDFMKIIARSRAEFRGGRTISVADMRAAFANGRPVHRRVRPSRSRRRSRTSARPARSRR